MNLVYTICDNAFIGLLPTWAKFLYWFNPSADVLCLIPRDFNYKKISNNTDIPSRMMFHELDNFIPRGGSARYRISEFNYSYLYKNFLYLDVDAFCCGDLRNVFETINANPKIIHGVTEVFDANSGGLFFKPNGRKPYKHGTRGFNSGTFGFSKESSGLVKLVAQRLVNKEYSDQAVFNDILAEENIFPTLDKYVRIMGLQKFRKSASTPVEEALIYHFIRGNIDNKKVALQKFLMSSSVISIMKKRGLRYEAK